MSKLNEIEVKKQDIISQMTNAVFYPDSTINKAELQKCKAYNTTDIIALGAAFTPLAQAIETLFTGEAKSGIYRVTVPEGGHLAKFKNGKGYLGSVLNTDNKVQNQAILSPVALDPMMIIMALAISSINSKFDEIISTQNEILSFFVQKERSELRGDLNFLADIYNNYKFNYDNDIYINNNHNKVLDIKQDAERKIDFYKNQIKTKIANNMAIKLDRDINKQFDTIVEDFSDYQIAMYIYAFSSFIDVLLIENFSSDFLNSITDKINNYSIEYRELYTDVYNKMEDNKKKSLQSTVIKGLSKANKAVANAVSKAPVISKSQFDESLVSIGDRFEERFYKRTEGKMKELFVSKKSAHVKPFIDNINSIDYLYNKASDIFIDNEKIYIETI